MSAVLNDGFIQFRWFHLCVPLWWMGSSWVVTFTRVRPGGRWVLPGSLDSLARAVRVFRFIRGRWLNCRAPWWSIGPDGDVGCTCARGHLVYPSSLVSFARALGVSSGAVGFTRVAVEFDGFIRVRWVRSHALRVFWFIRGRWVRSRVHGGRWDHPGSLDSLSLALRVDGVILDVDGFILGRCVRSRVNDPV